MRKLLTGLHLFGGLGGLAGSFLALNEGAQEAVGIHADEMLKNAPFQTFLIPGLLLLVVIGGGNLWSGYCQLRKKEGSDYLGIVMGCTMMAWILIQCVMLWAIVALHVIFFLFGLTQFVLACTLILKAHQPIPFSAHQN